ncbi:MAG: hypothetical protein ACFUZC_21730 [Chthoniobacteraceae bacterium]
MPVDDQTISKLLRLKRFEQPPAGYYDAFLREFQERQRAELLKRPVWRILLDRLDVLREEYLTLSNLSYGMASAAVLAVAAALSFNMLAHPGTGVGSSAATLAAHVNVPVPEEALRVASASVSAPVPMNAALTPQIRIPDALLESSYVTPFPGDQPPRYILDARPASYEPPFTF